MFWMRSVRTAGFAIMFLINSSFAQAQSIGGKSQKRVLSILSVVSKIDQKILEKFEQEKNIVVRVDFVGSSKEFEPHIRLTPRAWDLILCDERHLRRLVLSRILKPFPSGLAVKTESAHPLQRIHKLADDGRLYSIFMADPLGISWLASTRNAPLPVEWNWLVETQKNPLWRGRIGFPSFLDFQYRIALVATAQKPLPTKEEMDLALDWLRTVRSHVSVGVNGAEMRFLSDEIVASVLWKSEYLVLRKLIPELAFGIPKSGTYFERFGFGFVGEVQNEPLVVELMNFLNLHQSEFALAVNLVPLETDTEMGSPTQNWSLIEDEIPFSATVASELKKIAGKE